MKITKKGIMGMSISTVVMLVIAVVFIGVAVVFIRNVIPQDISINLDPKLNPTAQDPLVLSTGDFSIKTGREETLIVGFYNRQQNTVNAKVEFGECTSSSVSNEGLCGGIIKPMIVSLNWETEVGDSVEFITRIKASCLDAEGKEERLPPGTYLCGIQIQDSGNIIEQKQMPLIVTT